MLENLENTDLKALAIGPIVADVELKNYVLLAEPNGEERARKFLKRHRFKPYVPMEKKVKTRVVHGVFGERRIKVETMRPIFSGYLFLPLNWDWDFGPVNACPGLRQEGSKFMRMIGEDGLPKPVTLTDADMKKIRHIEETISPTHKVGDRVTVVDGPFMDLVAEISKLDDRGRIELVMDFLGKKTKFLANPSQITSL
jgi:transcription antitermination factor NusG